MVKVSPRTLSGFMELLPDRQAYFERMVGILRETFELYGFAPLDTPLIEASEVLLAKGGGETEKQVYRFMKGDSDLALRFDLTVPLAKYVALHCGQLAFPFKRYQIGKVYRGERAQRGRFREFYQADIDVVGDGKLDVMNEAEIPSVIYRCFSEMGLKRFLIRVNNRKALTGLFELSGVMGEGAVEAMRAVDKLEKVGREEVARLLVDEAGMAPRGAEVLLELLMCRERGDDPIARLKSLRGKSEALDRGVFELESVMKYMSAFGVPEANVAVDLSIARGLDYYTGTVYETAMAGHPEVGSICSGGRYDDLAGHYTDRSLPGVGISIGLTRLFYILEEQGYLNGALLSAPADVLILPMTDDLQPAISLATAMRREGIRVQIYGEDKKLKSKLAYADKLKIPYVVFMGEDELKKGAVTVKDMYSGEQTTASAAMVTAAIKANVRRLRSAAPIREPEAQDGQDRR